MRGLSRGAMARRAAAGLVSLARCGIALARCGIALAAVAASAASTQGQAVRITGVTITRYVEVRPLVTDSVPIDSTSGPGPLREATSRGVVVKCAPEALYCR